MEWIVLWTVFAIAAGGITTAKGRGWGQGLLWGGLLGIFGLIVVMFLPRVDAGASPKGWYPDGAGAERYWNGSAWSDLPPRPVG